MKLEDHVITIAQGKRLQELGVTVDAYFAHVLICPDPIGNDYYYDIIDSCHPMADKCEAICMAYTADELATMLPRIILMDGYNMLPALTRFDDEWICSYGAFSENKMTRFKSRSIAGAIALTLIHLLESKLITAAEVNARL